MNIEGTSKQCIVSKPLINLLCSALPSNLLIFPPHPFAKAWISSPVRGRIPPRSAFLETPELEP